MQSFVHELEKATMNNSSFVSFVCLLKIFIYLSIHVYIFALFMYRNYINATQNPQNFSGVHFMCIKV